MKRFIKSLCLILSIVFCFSVFGCSFGSTNNGGNSNGGSGSGTGDNNNPSNPTEYSYEDDMDFTGNWRERINSTKGETITVSKSTIRDKVLGAWIGNAIGLGSGFEYVHDDSADARTPNGTYAKVAFADKYWDDQTGRICGGSIGCNPYNLSPVCDSRVVQGKVFSDDDMHVDIMNQLFLREMGADLDAYDSAWAWSSSGYGVHDAGSGQYIRNIVDDYGLIAPYCGQGLYGNGQWMVSESWIESDSLGVTFPYMYQTEEAYSRIFSYTMGDGDASYLGRLCSLMSCLAYQYNDAKTIVEKAFDRMDRDHILYSMYQYILQEYAKGTPWRDVCEDIANMHTWIYERPESVSTAILSGGYSCDFSMSANGGMILLGLIYGDNSFEQSVKITALSGLDGDCTAATVGFIMGLMTGFDNLPQKYKNYMNGDSHYYNYSGSNISQETAGVSWGAFAYCDNKHPYDMTFNQIADLTVSNIETQIVARGGSVNGETYNICSQSLEKVSTAGVKSGSFEGDNSVWESSGSAQFTIDSGSSNYRTMNGMHAGKLTGDSSTSGRAYQTLNLIQGHRYRASVYVRRDSDREIRLFAGDKYFSYIRTNIDDGYTPSKYLPTKDIMYYKVEMLFTADSNSVDVGVELVAGSGSTNYIYFDDLAVVDETHLTESYYQGFDINQFYASSGFTKDGDAVKLTNGQGIKFEFSGYNGYQTFKIYCKNNSSSWASLKMYVDGKYCGVLPVQKNGDIDYNEASAVLADLYSGTGKHVFNIILDSDTPVSIQKIEVYGGNSSFIK